MVYFTKEHEWIKVEGDIGTVGITKHAAEHLGDVVFVDLPAAGRNVKQNEQIAVVESVKAASDIYAPVTGEIVAANEALVGTPAGVNESPEDSAWFFKIRISEPAELASLMDRAAYEAFLAASA